MKREFGASAAARRQRQAGPARRRGGRGGGGAQARGSGGRARRSGRAGGWDGVWCREEGGARGDADAGWRASLCARTTAEMARSGGPPRDGTGAVREPTSRRRQGACRRGRSRRAVGQDVRWGGGAWEGGWALLGGLFALSPPALSRPPPRARGQISSTFHLSRQPPAAQRSDRRAAAPARADEALDPSAPQARAVDTARRMLLTGRWLASSRGTKREGTKLARKFCSDRARAASGMGDDACASCLHVGCEIWERAIQRGMNRDARAEHGKGGSARETGAAPSATPLGAAPETLDATGKKG